MLMHARVAGSRLDVVERGRLAARQRDGEFCAAARAFAAAIAPPCASTTALQIARPRPTPGVADFARPRVNLSNRSARGPARQAGAVVAHVEHAARRRWRARRCAIGAGAVTWRRSPAG